MTTPRRDLRSGLSLWDARPQPAVKSGDVDASQVYDVAIIGAGISGALTAERISRRPGRHVVLDRRQPASGSTAASTALIQWEIDRPLSALSGQIGSRRARAAYQASMDGVQSLMRRIRGLGIDCNLVPRETLFLAGDAMDGKDLRREVDLRRKSGLPSTFLDAVALRARFPFARQAGILSRGSCELDPKRLTLGLLKVAHRRGADIVPHVNVVGIDATRSGVFLTLEGGTVLAARRVIAATGYEALPQIPTKDYRLVSTWALATQAISASAIWDGAALVWEAADPYLYFRTGPGRCIVVGGEDEDFTDPRRRDRAIARKSRTILRKLRDLLPGADPAVAHAWAGTFAESPTGLPVIGEVAGLPNVFAILGAGGNGITFSAIASDMAAAWAVGAAHRHGRLFAA